MPDRNPPIPYAVQEHPPSRKHVAVNIIVSCSLPIRPLPSSNSCPTSVSSFPSSLSNDARPAHTAPRCRPKLSDGGGRAGADAGDGELWVGAVLHLHVERRAGIVGATSAAAIVDVGDGLGGAGLQLAHGGTGHRSGGCGGTVVQVVVRAPARLLQRDVARRLGEVALGFDEARLQVDDVVAQLVVLGLDGLVVLVQQVVVADLLLEFLDVAFFALPEGALCQALVSWSSLSCPRRKKGKKKRNR